MANADASAPLTPVAGITDELFDSLLDANTRATFYVLRAAARTVRDGGRIINISSSSVRFPAAGFAAYATSKSGALTTIGILATELGARGITANSIMAWRDLRRVPRPRRVDGRRRVERILGADLGRGGTTRFGRRYADAAELLERCPAPTLAVIEDAGHAGRHERPDLLATLFGDWLDRVGQ